MSKKAVEVSIDEKEVREVVPTSERKKAFAELIERYKVQSPSKYEAKKEALKEKLNNIK